MSSYLTRKRDSVAWFRKRVWLFQLRRRGCLVDSSIHVKGGASLNTIKLDSPLRVEQQCTIWLSDEEQANPLLEIGANAFVGRNCYLGVYYPLRVGQDTIIGAYSYIITANHRHSELNIPIAAQGYEGKEISISNNVWIGCHVTILPGVMIEAGAIVAAGAVVTRDIGENEIWGGVPAKKIGVRGKSLVAEVDHD